MFKLQTAWDDTLDFIRREQALLLPLSFGTIGLGNLLLAVCQDRLGVQADSVTTPALLCLILVAILWSALGELAIMHLVLQVKSSVREALVCAARRLPVLIGIQIFVASAITLVAVPALLPLLSKVHGNDMSDLRPTPGMLLWLILVLGIALWFVIRILPIRAVVMDQRGGVIKSLKTAFTLSRGSTKPLFAFVFLFSGVTLITLAAAHVAVGTLILIIGRALNSPFTAAVLEALVQSILISLFGLVELVFIAMAYRQLMGPSPIKHPFG